MAEWRPFACLRQCLEEVFTVGFGSRYSRYSNFSYALVNVGFLQLELHLPSFR